MIVCECCGGGGGESRVSGLAIGPLWHQLWCAFHFTIRPQVGEDHWALANSCGRSGSVKRPSSGRL